MFQLFGGLGRADQPAGAAAHRVDPAGLFVLLAHRMAAAGRTERRKLEGLCGISGAFVQIDVDNLRDHIAGALDLDRIANAQILAVPDRFAILADALDIVLVVQGCVGNDTPPTVIGSSLATGVSAPGAANLDLDVVEHGEGLLGRKLVRNGPAGRPGDEAEPFLQIQTVDLVDNTVNIVVELRPAFFNAVIDAEQLLDASRSVSSAD